MDNRSGLSPGTQIVSNEDNKIILNKEIGRGASCIVYDATYVDKIGVHHNVRIKECYPVWLFLKRDEFGNLSFADSYNERFLQEKQRFIESYKKNAIIRNTIGLVNSTINLSDMIAKNNTYYAIMSFDEGCDYRKYTDRSLKELLEHIKSLSIIIGKYHKSGYLHLDIKPENLLIIPETREHVLLFDFDSIISIDDLRNNKGFTLSYSDGFSAPEQVQGKINKIGFHTDIYAIGAILFYKLFNRGAKFNDGAMTAHYDFTVTQYPDKRYQPLLYRKLSYFLHKSIALSTVSRWNDIDNLIKSLDELILLADVNRVFVYDNFQYNTANFLGRSEELNKIKFMLKDNQIIFISGIGGIGKTELVKKYASMNRDNYNSIIFCRYNDSIIDLVTNEIDINGIEQEQDENEEKYFTRKLDILKETLTSNDLIIVDNLDTDEDEKLEELFSCPCKFIVTTREDFRDYNYQQLNLDKIEDLEEIKEIFQTYNDNEYGEEELKYIEKIMQLVDNHTMTVELIAKYLRETQENPKNLYERFLEIEGVTNVEDIKIKQRKDRQLRAANVKKHLNTLFDISNFSQTEQEIMRSLSLMGSIRIQKSKFIEMLKLDSSNIIDRLIKRGWIEYNDVNNKISLHQIILDLIYVDLKPTTENCPHITKSMIDYLKKKP